MPTSRNLQQMSFTDPTGFPSNWSNTDIPIAVGNVAARRKELAALKKPPPVSRSGASSAGAHFEPHMESTGESASMGATEGENIPDDPPLKATIGDTNQAEAPLAAIVFGENFSSWTQLMDRWALYNKEIFCEGEVINPMDEHRADSSYTCININMDFPPFPGPSPINYKWGLNTNTPAGELYAPFIAGTGTLAIPEGELASNAGYNMAPAGKFFLNAPYDDNEGPVDLSYLLKVNPGELTIMHMVTRMFLGRKGAIKNKYVLNGNSNITAAPSGTQLMTVKRLSDSGVLAGNCYLTNSASAQDVIALAQVNTVQPCSGNMWNQASCRIGNGESKIIYGADTWRLRKCQSLNGDTQSCAAPCGAPNWFNPLEYPAAAPPVISGGGAPVNAQTRGDLMLANYYDGVHVTTTKQQPVIEVEIPFYVNTRFLHNNLVLTNTKASPAHAVLYESSVKDKVFDQIAEHQAQMTYVERYVKPGADFSLFYLANVPMIYLNANHLYPTSNSTNLDIVMSSYSYLRYRAPARQTTSAFRTLAMVPAGSNVYNTYPNDPYFFEMDLSAQGVPLAIPSGAA